LVSLRDKQVAPKDAGWVRDALTGRYETYGKLARNTDGKIHPYEICRAVNDALLDDGIYIGDGGDIQFWMFGGQRIQRPRTFLDMYPFFSVGVGIPLALGAAAAARDMARNEGRAPSPVVLVTGDGAFGFYCAELGSFDMAGLPAVIVVGNDGAWGMEVHGQQAAINRAINTQLKEYDYQLVAQAYGCTGERIEQPGALKDALANAMQSNRCTVLNVIMDQGSGAALKTNPHLLNVIFDDVPSMRAT
jgi:acetolactate synthase-1/2/3 large subunit